MKLEDDTMSDIFFYSFSLHGNQVRINDAKTVPELSSQNRIVLGFFKYVSIKLDALADDDITFLFSWFQ